MSIDSIGRQVIFERKVTIMARIKWDSTGEKRFEAGVDHGVLYRISEAGEYTPGVAWNGITSVAETPEGAEPESQYADNVKYLTLVSAEELNGTIEAYTYPDEWGECDGTAEIAPGVAIGQQNRAPFGLCYRTKVGNDIKGQDYGYKLHLLYGALASPSERTYETLNDSPEAITFSWEYSTTPVPVKDHNPTALLVIDSTKVTDKTALANLEKILYGSDATAADGEDPGATDTPPRMPLPDEVAQILAGNTGAAEVARMYNLASL